MWIGTHRIVYVRVKLLSVKFFSHVYGSLWNVSTVQKEFIEFSLEILSATSSIGNKTFYVALFLFYLLFLFFLQREEEEDDVVYADVNTRHQWFPVWYSFIFLQRFYGRHFLNKYFSYWMRLLVLRSDLFKGHKKSACCIQIYFEC